MPPASPDPIQQALAAAVRQHQAGQFAEAEAAYNEILRLQPHHAEALHLIGVVAHQTGRHDLAVERIRRSIAIAPNSASAHSNLGEAHRARGDLDEAMACYRRALDINPRYAIAAFNLGNALSKRKQFKIAITAYRHVIALWPDYAEVHNNLGLALAELRQFDEAEAAYRRALECKPGYAEAEINLAHVLKHARRFDEARAALRRAIALQPGLADAYIGLGNVYRDEDRLEDAVTAYRRAIALKPGFAGSSHNLGIALGELGRWPEAEAAYRDAIASQQDFAEAHMNLGLVLLLTGRYEEGWTEYEWMARVPIHAHRLRGFRMPFWTGEPAPGKTILIHTEQGFGDTVQFARYLPLARAQSGAARLLFECPAILAALFRQIEGGGIEIVIRGDSPATLPAFDLHQSLFSLPLTLRRFEPVPMDAPYFRADEQLRQSWRERLGPAAEPRVGLVWAGNPLHENDRRRSIPPARLAPILDVTGIEFISLQMAGPLPPPLAGAGVRDLGRGIADFSDSAALLAELDLLISVDTAPAHLAGAIGRPVWTLLPFRPDWRWGLHREDTPWYPTMRLFRQHEEEDWGAVTERVAAALREMFPGSK